MADAWQETVGMSDEQVTELIRLDQLDILVDLNMHMARGRLLVFARKPAPVQVCWLAYPGTTGLSAMDYRLSDPQLDPPGLVDQCYSEQTIRLLETFWCYDPLTIEPAVNPLPALSQGHVTFGSLNNFCKVNDAVLVLWADVLWSVDHSRLLVLAENGSHRRRTLGFFEQCGIAPQRVSFVDPRPRDLYLRLYHEIDIGLDTFPANGHTTSMDASWMGIPVVTLKGQTAIGRGGVSLLHSLALEELVAETPAQYVKIAAGLASDLSRLRNMRQTLRQRMKDSPLMDASRFARHMEAAYRSMWRQWCSGQAGQ
jgi:predicted O-linked N-acetylglucosamine transferase (SPINDLY family)